MKLGNDIARTRCSGFKISKSILILFATVFVAFFVSASTQAEEPCDTTKLIGNFSLLFVEVTYDSIAGTSTWDYELTWDGTAPSLSHFTIELCTLITNSNLISADPSNGVIAEDGSTGLYGIKWDNIENFPADTAIIFSFTLDQMYAADHSQFAPKAGVNFNIATICGPSTDCDIIGDPCDNNIPPTASCPSIDTIFVCDLSQICLPGFNCSDPDGNLASSTLLGGTLSGDTACFTPVAGDNLLTLICVDSCNAADTCETTIHIVLNSSPTATYPSSDTLFVCDLSQICLPGFSCSDADGNLVSSTLSGGSLSGDTACFTPVEGDNVLTLICVDECGAADTCETIIHVVLNSAPVATCPAGDTLFVCDLSQICLPGFASSDPDGNISSINVTGGSLSGDTVCFTPVQGDNVITMIVTDVCGAADTCQTTIHIVLNSAPVASCPAGDTLFVCDLSQICLPGFTSSDPDGNISSINVTGGSLSGDTVCFTPVQGENVITMIATDVCGAADTCETIIHVVLNSAPVASCPAGDTLFVCDLSPICLPGFSCSDPDGNLASSTLFGGTLSGDTACFTPVEGDNVLTLICIDDCGAADTCETVIHVVLNSAPVAACPPSDTIFVCDLSEICVDGFSCTDPDGNFASATAIGGSLNGTQICFTPVEGDNIIGIICTDSCGVADTCEVTITVIAGVPPEISITAFDTVLTCTIGDPICIPLQITDPGSGLSGTFSLGNIDFGDSTACFAPGDTGGVYCGTVIITDSCGLADTAEVCIFVTVNGPPVIEESTREVVNVCAGDSVCIEYNVTDPNNNLVLEEIRSNPLNAVIDTLNNTVCFVAPDSGCYKIVLRATDGCEAFDEDTITVCVIEQPVATCPGNFTQFVCDLSQICVPGFSTQNADTSYAIGGTLSGNTICFTPVEGSNTIKLVAENECGADTCSVTITIDLNSPPVASCPASRTDTVCFLDDPICISGFSVSDDDGNLESCTLNGQSFNPSSPYCFIPIEGANNFTLVCVDSCGASSSCSFTINVVVDPSRCGDSCAVISIEKTHDTPQGQYEEVKITIDTLPYEIGGLDLLIEYDASALSLSSIATGSFITNCGWEYFTYRNGAAGNCGASACPSGKVRILSLAETNNGANHPSCFQGAPAEIAKLRFLVTNDRTFECQYVPIRFCWYDCGDNTLSSKAGDTLYISRTVYNYFDGVIWNEITDISAEFPSLYGANYTCDVDLGDGKPDPIRSVCFYNGGIDIVCADSIDDRGDINLNGVPYEVADAVLLGNYFIYGLSVFTINLEGQIAASDVNADGTVLSVADLVYLVRIVLGDALPYSKMVASVNIDFYHYSDGRLTVGEKTAIGAAYVVAEGNITPKLLASEMDMKYHFDGSNTRILVWSESGSSFTGDFLQIDADLISFELATAEGQPVSLNTLPTAYELMQNYPNPFNPTTVISFTLPNASEYSLTIFNLNGQVVKTFEGMANSAGTIELEWQAVDVASGVYFYRLKANSGRYIETKKMILLK